jgi:hypothetical protein
VRGTAGAQPNVHALVLQLLWSLVVLLILIDMIWKPGA